MCSLFVFSWDFTLILKIHKVYDSLSVKCSYKENTACNCCRNVGHFLFCIRAFALHLQQPETDKQNADFAHLWKNFCRRPCMQSQVINSSAATRLTFCTLIYFGTDSEGKCNTKFIGAKQITGSGKQDNLSPSRMISLFCCEETTFRPWVRCTEQRFDRDSGKKIITGWLYLFKDAHLHLTFYLFTSSI